MNINGFEVKDGILDLSGTSVTVIENKAFWAARAIREVLLPGGMEHIGDWAFAKCSNLERVTFPDDFRPDLFGRDVFKGCDRLKHIGFNDSDDVTAHFLALCANRLGFDRLIQSDDIGKKSWYEKWDICLATRIKSDDAEARMSAALCGEEDISYDGIGSVDGEMSGESEDFVSAAAYNRSILCYVRLINDRYLSDDMRHLLEKHISDNRFGEGYGSSFYAIFEECGGDLGLLQKYLDIVKPDRKMLLEMTSALSASEVAAKSYLIGRPDRGEDPLADLLL